MHPKIQQLLEKRLDMSRNGNIDWGFGELLAFGSLLVEGTPVRLAGQDSRRGTFVQRHAALHDRANGQEWLPLSNLSDAQGRFFVYDSSSASTPHSASSTATPWKLPRPWCSGRRSSATSSTARSRSSTSTSPPRSRSGVSSPASPSCSPRLRGSGAGPLLRTHRAVPAAVRTGQHDRGASVDAGVALPPAAPSGLCAPAQAADRVHPEGDAAPAGSDEPGRGVHRRSVRAGHRRRPRSRSFRREARPRAQRQGALGPPRRAGEEPEPGDRPGASGAALPDTHRRAEEDHRLVPERRARMGAGGAGEPGRLAVPGPRVRGCPRRPLLPPRVASGFGVSGDGLVQGARHRAGRSDPRGGDPADPLSDDEKGAPASAGAPFSSSGDQYQMSRTEPGRRRTRGPGPRRPRARRRSGPHRAARRHGYCLRRSTRARRRRGRGPPRYPEPPRRAPAPRRRCADATCPPRNRARPRCGAPCPGARGGPGRERGGDVQDAEPTVVVHLLGDPARVSDEPRQRVVERTEVGGHLVHEIVLQRESPQCGRRLRRLADEQTHVQREPESAPRSARWSAITPRTCPDSSR